MKKEKSTRPSSGKRKMLIILCSVLAFVLVLLIAATAFVEYQVGRLGDLDNSTLSSDAIDDILNGETGTGPHMNDSDVDFGDAVDVLDEEHIINIMLVGQDRREGQGRQRSDAMILMSLDTKNGEIKLSSFLRDSYVNIPGYGYMKLNAACVYGGPQLVCDTIEANFGIRIDDYAKVGYDMFIKIIGSMLVFFALANFKYF